MVIDTQTARYLMRVVEVHESGVELPTTDTCRDCGETVTAISSGQHVVIASPDLTSLTAVVIIGCEGYWHVDPASVGITGTGWNASPDSAVYAADHAGPIG